MPLRRRSILAGLLSAALLLGACSDGTPETVENADPTTTLAAVDPGCDARVAGFPNHVAYAKEPGAIAVYDAPDGNLVQTFESPRMTDSDPPIPVDLVFLAKTEPEDNCDWLEVYLPIRPNGSTGWLKRADVRMEGNSYRMEVNLAEFNIKAYEGDKVILDTDIGVARDNAPTPGGLYYTTELLATGDDNSLYGPWAFGLSGFSDTYTSFNGGQGQLGIHGTNEPDKIGQKVSAGCIRLRNEDIEMLVDTLQVQQGIPVTVNA